MKTQSQTEVVSQPYLFPDVQPKLISNIPQGTSIDSVKQIQPDFIEIDRSNPVKSDSETRYIITKIKNSNDALQMENYLSFMDNKYQARFTHK